MAGTFDNYARALWELHVPENRVSEAAELLKDNPVLWEALKNPVICLKEKERIIDRIFPEEMRGFLKTVCSYGRASSLGPPSSCGGSGRALALVSGTPAALLLLQRPQILFLSQ